MDSSGADDTALYEAVIRAGARMPHCQLERKGGGEGRSVSTVELCAAGGLSGVVFEKVEEGDARSIAVKGVMGAEGGEESEEAVLFADASGDLRRLMGSARGVCVRPDGFVSSVF